MNILITGANGQLGNEMRVLSKENGQHAYFFTDVQELDICDEQARLHSSGDNFPVAISLCSSLLRLSRSFSLFFSNLMLDGEFGRTANVAASPHESSVEGLP